MALRKEVGTFSLKPPEASNKHRKHDGDQFENAVLFADLFNVLHIAFQEDTIWFDDLDSKQRRNKNGKNERENRFSGINKLKNFEFVKTF